MIDHDTPHTDQQQEPIRDSTTALLLCRALANDLLLHLPLSSVIEFVTGFYRQLTALYDLQVDLDYGRIGALRLRLSGKSYRPV